MAFKIEVKLLSAQPVLAIKRRVTVDQLNRHISVSLERLYAELREQHAAADGAPFGILDGPIGRDRDGPIEVCVPLRADARSSGEVVGRRVSGGQFACVTLRGRECAFPEVLKGYAAVYNWVRRRGYRAPEPPREVWHNRDGAAQTIEIVLLFRERPRMRI